MIGWILRFSYNMKNKGKRIKGELNCEEIEESETRLLKIIQLESFGKIDLGLIHNLQVLRITEMSDPNQVSTPKDEREENQCGSSSREVTPTVTRSGRLVKIPKRFEP
ncbi:hypothetical protein JTB14_007622 [Gonioctena quinquepunctata]|nr:hypothetical protein JTB14_007622 [Gonioctena quinquepunctata]